MFMLCDAGMQRGNFVPRGPSGSRQDSRRGASHGSSSRADAVPGPDRTAASQRAGQYGREVGQGSTARGLPAISAGQFSSRAGQVVVQTEEEREEAGQGVGAGLGRQGTGQSSNRTSSSSNHAEQFSGGIGRYSRADQSGAALPLRDSIQGLLKPKQDAMQASQLLSS